MRTRVESIQAMSPVYLADSPNHAIMIRSKQSITLTIFLVTYIVEYTHEWKADAVIDKRVIWEAHLLYYQFLIPTGSLPAAVRGGRDRITMRVRALLLCLFILVGPSLVHHPHHLTGIVSTIGPHRYRGCSFGPLDLVSQLL